MFITTRKQQKLEDVINDIPLDYTTQEDPSSQEAQEDNTTQEENQAPKNSFTEKDKEVYYETKEDGDVFHDSISDISQPLVLNKSFANDPMKEITLEMIFL